MDPKQRADILRNLFEPTSAEVCWDLSHPTCVDAATGMTAADIPAFKRVLTIPCLFAIRYTEKDVSASTRAVYYPPTRAKTLTDTAAQIVDAWCMEGRTFQQLERVLGISNHENRDASSVQLDDAIAQELRTRHVSLATLESRHLSQVLQGIHTRTVWIRLPLTRQIMGVAMFGKCLLETVQNENDANSIHFVNCMSGYKLHVYTTRAVQLGARIVLHDDGPLDFVTSNQSDDVLTLWSARSLTPSSDSLACANMFPLLRLLVTPSDGGGGVKSSQEVLAKRFNRSKVNMTQVVHAWLKQWWVKWRRDGRAACVPLHQLLLTCAAMQLWDPVSKKLASDDLWFVDLMQAWTEVYGTPAPDTLLISLIGTEAWLNNTAQDSSWYRTLARCIYR